MQRQYNPPAEYMETQASELETEENKENIVTKFQ